MSTLKEIRAKFEAKQADVFSIFEKAKTEKGEYDFSKSDHPELKGLEGTVAKLEKIRSMEKEVNDLHDEAVKQADVEAGVQRLHDQKFAPASGRPSPGDGGGALPRELKSFGELVTSHPEFKRHFVEQRSKGGVALTFPEMYPSDVLGKFASFDTLGNVHMKALFSTTAGWAPESIRLPGFVEAATRPIQVLDIVPLGRTSFEQVVFMEETTRTHAAAEKAEGVAFAESTFVLTEKTSSVRKVTDSIPVTDEQLEDVAQAESYLNGRIVFGLRQRLDGQVLAGNGTAPNLQGLDTLTGTNTQAKGTDPVPDAFFKAGRLVRVTGRAMPTHALIHPTDWEKVRLLRTADGVYIWGNPSEAGPERIWGWPVVQEDIIAAGTGFVGSFQPQWVSLFERRGVDVQVGFVGTQFTEGKRTIRADMRMALVFFRPAAFSKVTEL